VGGLEIVTHVACNDVPSTMRDLMLDNLIPLLALC
jgi:hypothetical protein